MYTGLWAYAAVFVGSVSTVIPLRDLSDETATVTWLLVFAAIAVTLSCLDLTEQVGVQTILAVARGVTFVLMLSCVIAGLYSNPYTPPRDTHLLTWPKPPPIGGQHLLGTEGAHLSTPPYTQKFVWWDVVRAGPALTTLTFAFLFQHSVTGIMGPLVSKRRVRWVFGGAIVTCAVLYLALGFVCAVYFGGAVQPAINVNYVDLSFMIPHTGGPLPWYLRAISYFCVLFPAIDTLSVFPLVSITLGNSLQYFFRTASFSSRASPPSRPRTLPRSGSLEGGMHAYAQRSGQSPSGSPRTSKKRSVNGLGSGGSGVVGIEPVSRGGFGGAPSGGRRAPSPVTAGEHAPLLAHTHTHTHGSTATSNTHVQRYGGGDSTGSGQALRRVARRPWFRSFCRALASVPPIVACGFSRDLSSILQLSGFFGLFVAFVCPTLMITAARRKTRKRFDIRDSAPLTFHSLTWGGGVLARAFVWVLAMFVFVFYLASLLL
jgi:hypothetical protein